MCDTVVLADRVLFANAGAVISVCFVCLGNICRSPTAEGIFLHLVAREGLAERVWADSAGTAAYSIGEPADPRSRETAHARGVELTSRGRQFEHADFENFDYVVAMDGANEAAIRAMTRDPERLAKVHLLRDFDPEAQRESDVPDPYSGGPSGFDDVFDLIEAACRGLLDHLVQRHRLSS